MGERLYRKFKNLSTGKSFYTPIVRGMKHVPPFERARDANAFALQARIEIEKLRAESKSNEQVENTPASEGEVQAGGDAN